MPRGKVEQAGVIIPKLREVEVELGRGKTVAKDVKMIGVTEQTYYDFVMDRTPDGRPIRMLTIVDEYTRECLAIDWPRSSRAITSWSV